MKTLHMTLKNDMEIKFVLVVNPSKNRIKRDPSIFSWVITWFLVKKSDDETKVITLKTFEEEPIKKSLNSFILENNLQAYVYKAYYTRSSMNEKEFEAWINDYCEKKGYTKKWKNFSHFLKTVMLK